ncbi:MAG: hypothetical protein HY735_24190 [Verrucomicrobia bacterium]|nr:hypothetical protein [Verrucomicrobiota bacterium]
MKTYDNLQSRSFGQPSTQNQTLKMKTLKSLTIGLISAAILSTALPSRAQELPNPAGLTPFATDTDVTIGFERDGEVYYLSGSPQMNNLRNWEVEIVPSAQLSDRARWTFKWFYEDTFGAPYVVIQNQASGHFLITESNGDGDIVGQTTYESDNISLIRWFLVSRIDGRVNLFQRGNRRFLTHLNENPLRTDTLPGSDRNSSRSTPIPAEGDWRFNLQPARADSDGDGVPDDRDTFPNSILTPTVIIGGQDTGVPNTRFSDGSTISDQIAKRAAAAKNHGQFVSAVAELTNWLKSEGLITGAQKGAIDSAAAKSNKF